MKPKLSEADVMKWQPIETAPKDGTEILTVKHGVMVINNWHRCWMTRKGQELVYNDWQWQSKPTHWMPLPDPPEVPNEEKGEA